MREFSVCITVTVMAPLFTPHSIPIAKSEFQCNKAWVTMKVIGLDTFKVMGIPQKSQTLLVTIPSVEVVTCRRDYLNYDYLDAIQSREGGCHWHRLIAAMMGSNWHNRCTSVTHVSSVIDSCFHLLNLRLSCVWSTLINIIIVMNVTNHQWETSLSSILWEREWYY